MSADARLTDLEAKLDREYAKSREAAARLAVLEQREIAITHEHPPVIARVAPPTGVWTLEALKEHFEALRAADERYYTERDRRYAEVNIERENALKIKETADLAALGLAREIQDYKDEKANNLRSQIEGERGHYATKDDLKQAVDKIDVTIKPITEFVSQQRGQRILLAALATVVAIALSGAGVLIAILARG